MNRKNELSLIIFVCSNLEYIVLSQSMEAYASHRVEDSNLKTVLLFVSFDTFS